MEWQGRALSGAAVVALLIAGCGTQRTGERGHAVRSKVAAMQPIELRAAGEISRRAPLSLRLRALPVVGLTQHVESRGAALSVTLREVIDPLSGSGAVLEPGTRAVGVIVQIRNAGPALYDSSATGDFTVAASGGAVTPVLAKRGICRTPLEDFDRYITAGEDRVGCVVFAVSDASVLDAVSFSPHAQASGRLSWAP